MTEEVAEAYSQVADVQLDEIGANNQNLYNDVLTVCRLVFTDPARAQSMSTAVTTQDGIVLRLAVPGHAPYKIFWTSAEPRIEAVFPHP